MDNAIKAALWRVKKECVDKSLKEQGFTKNAKIVLLTFEDDDESYAHMLQIQKYLNMTYMGSKIDDVTVMRMNYRTDNKTCTPGWKVFNQYPNCIISSYPKEWIAAEI